MNDGRLRPPGGESPPESVSIGQSPTLDLKPLAREICRRYRLEFPHEQPRYGRAGGEWCVHDNQHLLHWAAESVDGFVDLNEQVAWLARVLKTRRFPLSRLARNLDLAADVTRQHVKGALGMSLAAAFVGAACFVRS